jgi:TatD DNase family protein
MIDSHAHIDLPPLCDDVAGVLARARAAGVLALLCVGTDPAASRRCIALAEAHPGFVYPTVGIQPSYVAESGDGAVEEIVCLAADPRVVAVGETGLDYHYDYTPRAEQLAALERHVELAIRLDKPLILHCRKAGDDLLAVLRGVGATLKGVRHCFDRPWAEAEPFLDLGLHIGIGAAITRAGYRKFKDAACRIPADRLLIETDCPYQTPAGRAGQPNEPAFLVDTLRALADVRNESSEALAASTAANTRELFGLPGAASDTP